MGLVVMPFSIIALRKPYNQTGYAQALEEKTSGTHPNIIYTIGDDVITQSKYNGPNPSNYTNKHLLYDGHGSVRHLADSQTAVLHSKTGFWTHCRPARETGCPTRN